jgi:hypothetical protein
MKPEVEAIQKTHEDLDRRGRQLVGEITSRFLDLAVVAAEVLEKKTYERFRFVDPGPYFEENWGISYRTLRRILTVHEGILRLPEAERDDARVAIAALGSHKAAVVAPLLGREEYDWRAVVQTASSVPEKALQSEVSRATGARPRGALLAPGEAFLGYVLNQVPVDARDEVEETFRLGKTLSGANPMGVFLAMIRECRAEWSARIGDGERSGR